MAEQVPQKVGIRARAEGLLHDEGIALCLAGKPSRLMGDRAHDSDPTDRQPPAQGIELIATHRGNRIKPLSKESRVLRRCQGRWKIERLFSGFQNFHPLDVRYEHRITNAVKFPGLPDIV